MLVHGFGVTPGIHKLECLFSHFPDNPASLLAPKSQLFLPYPRLPLRGTPTPALLSKPSTESHERQLHAFVLLAHDSGGYEQMSDHNRLGIIPTYRQVHAETTSFLKGQGRLTFVCCCTQSIYQNETTAPIRDDPYFVILAL